MKLSVFLASLDRDTHANALENFADGLHSHYLVRVPQLVSYVLEYVGMVGSSDNSMQIT